jgi:hypothetical protein
MCGAAQMRERRQRYLVRRIFLQTGFVSHPAHDFPPVIPRNVALGTDIAESCVHWKPYETNDLF